MKTGKVSLIWINYNSMSFIDKVLESLRATLNLDYSNYELIIVDNHSTDGSFEVIKDFVKGFKPKCKVTRTSRNYGYSDGANIGYRLKDKDSEYVGIVNNDLVPYGDSLRTMVEVMENEPRLGAVQGKVLSGDEIYIDSAGGFFSEDFRGPIFTARGHSAHEFNKPMHVTFVEGVYPLYRVKAVMLAIGMQNVMFVPGSMFYYLEDVFLSLRLWNAGYKCVYIPKAVGKHYRAQTITKYRSIVHNVALRNRIALKRILSKLKWHDFIFRLWISTMWELFKWLRSENQDLRCYQKMVVTGWLYGADVAKIFGKIDASRCLILRKGTLRAHVKKLLL